MRRRSPRHPTIATTLPLPARREPYPTPAEPPPLLLGPEREPAGDRYAADASAAIVMLIACGMALLALVALVGNWASRQMGG